MPRLSGWLNPQTLSGERHRVFGVARKLRGGACRQLARPRDPRFMARLCPLNQRKRGQTDRYYRDRERAGDREPLTARGSPPAFVDKRGLQLGRLRLDAGGGAGQPALGRAELFAPQ